MNIGILAVAITWAFISNSYFGWNWKAKSGDELICDGIFAILLCLAIK